MATRPRSRRSGACHARKALMRLACRRKPDTPASARLGSSVATRTPRLVVPHSLAMPAACTGATRAICRREGAPWQSSASPPSLDVPDQKLTGGTTGHTSQAASRTALLQRRLPRRTQATSMASMARRRVKPPTPRRMRKVRLLLARSSVWDLTDLLCMWGPQADGHLSRLSMATPTFTAAHPTQAATARTTERPHPFSSFVPSSIYRSHSCHLPISSSLIIAIWLCATRSLHRPIVTAAATATPFASFKSSSNHHVQYPPSSRAHTSAEGAFHLSLSFFASLSLPLSQTLSATRLCRSHSSAAASACALFAAMLTCTAQPLCRPLPAQSFSSS